MENQTKKLEILVVDDQPESMDAAKKYFEKIDDVSATYVADANQAFEYIRSGRYDGVLQDVFMPVHSELALKAYERIKNSVTSTQDESFYISLDAIELNLHKEAPVGILLQEEAKEKGIPCVLVSSLEHHAKTFQAILIYIEERAKLARSEGKAAFEKNLKSGSFYEGSEGTHVVSGKEMPFEFKNNHPEKDKRNPEYWAEAYKKLRERTNINVDNYWR